MKESSRIIIKADGDKVDFLPEKLIRSLERVGANKEVIQQITGQVEAKFYPEMNTGVIYRLVYQELKRRSRPLAARYKLRRAVQELGPSGYPFEAYIGEIFRHLGYEVQVGAIENGRCITHEVDVLADREGRRIAVECKFGNSSSKRLDVKVSLYIYSRFLDLSNQWIHKEGFEKKDLEGWIVTNGSFSDDARNYGNCVGLRLVSWSHPATGNLKDLIENSALYPITVLASLNKHEKKELLKLKIVLAKSIRDRIDLLEGLHMSPTRIKRCLAEVDGLCC